MVNTSEVQELAKASKQISKENRLALQADKLLHTSIRQTS